MSQALVISDNEVLNDLYSINLEAYVGTNVTVKNDVDEAIKLLELNPNFDIVIALSMIKGEEVATRIADHLNVVGSNTPLIVVGLLAEVPPGVKVIETSYDLKALVREVAKVLEITAKDMVSKSVPEFYPVPLRVFYNVEKVPCDIFFRVRKSEDDVEYLNIMQMDQSIYPTIKEYEKEGVTTLYVDAMDRLTFINNTSDAIVLTLQNVQDSPMDQKVEVVEQVSNFVAENLFSSEQVTEEVAEISKECIKTIRSVITEVPSVKALLSTMLNNNSKYLYNHGIVATYIANHIVNNISWGGESHLEKLNFVLFFHDMYLGPIYNKYPHLKFEEELIYSEELSDKEREFILNHARIASEAIKKFPRCPIGADAIIKQHHGTTNGVGFSVEFKDDISPLAKVIAISEYFAEEMIKVIDEKGHMHLDRDDIIFKCKQKFTRNAYVKIIETLGNIKL